MGILIDLFIRAYNISGLSCKITRKGYNRDVHSNGSKYGLSEIVRAVHLRAVGR